RISSDRERGCERASASVAPAARLFGKLSARRLLSDRRRGQREHCRGLILLERYLATEDLTQHPSAQTVTELQADDLVRRLIEKDAEAVVLTRDGSDQRELRTVGLRRLRRRRRRRNVGLGHDRGRWRAARRREDRSFAGRRQILERDRP